MADTYTVRYTASYWEQACAGSIYLAAQGDRGRISRADAVKMGGLVRDGAGRARV